LGSPPPDPEPEPDPGAPFPDPWGGEEGLEPDEISEEKEAAIAEFSLCLQ
jgi:hypothetical protein